MSFDVTYERRRWRDLYREHARDVIRPRAEALDRERARNDIVSEMASRRLTGSTPPEECGGSGGGFFANNMTPEGECRTTIPEVSVAEVFVFGAAKRKMVDR